VCARLIDTQYNPIGYIVISYAGPFKQGMNAALARQPTRKPPPAFALV
jgi:hypothetical protein